MDLSLCESFLRILFGLVIRHNISRTPKHIFGDRIDGCAGKNSRTKNDTRIRISAFGRERKKSNFFELFFFSYFFSFFPSSFLTGRFRRGVMMRVRSRARKVLYNRKIQNWNKNNRFYRIWYGHRTSLAQTPEIDEKRRIDRFGNVNSLGTNKKQQQQHQKSFPIIS